MIHFFRTIFVVTLIAGAISTAPAAKAASFDISWTGAGGYTMTGEFDFNDALLNTGVITSVDLGTFVIEGFLNNVSVGSWDFVADGLAGSDLFNLNFDTNTLQFLVGGTGTGPTGQLWGAASGAATCQASGFGFGSGLLGQGVCVNGTAVPASLITGSTLTATPSSAVPEPTTVSLFALGLLALGARTRRRRR